MNNHNPVEAAHGCGRRPSQCNPSNHKAELHGNRSTHKQGWEHLDKMIQQQTADYQERKQYNRMFGKSVENKFDSGRKNNIVASFYGSDIFNYIQPTGSRYCR